MSNEKKYALSITVATLLLIVTIDLIGKHNPDSIIIPIIAISGVMIIFCGVIASYIIFPSKK